MAQHNSSSGLARSAVVTGAARGIGREIAALLVERGYVVVVTDRVEADAQETARQIGAHSAMALDVTDPAANREVAVAASQMAPLAVWVCNAGVLFEGDASALTERQIASTMDVNVNGVLWGVRAATAVFREQASVGVRGGDIAIMASLSAHSPVAGLSVYAASKAAVLSLATSLVSELRADRIRIHALCPDGVDTQMVRSMGSDSDARQILAAGVLFTPRDVARQLVDMIGTRRVIKTMPAWRGVLARVATLAPGFAARVDGPMKRIGARRLRKGKAVAVRSREERPR